jgi:hypothetical protein
MNEVAMQKIRELLGEPKKLWHNIHASTTTELLNKLRMIAKIMVET